MIDNLFVVESPLQALVALELNMQLKYERNGIIYRFSGNRDRNNKQIEAVINKGQWSYIKKVAFNKNGVLSNHLSILKELNSFRKVFPKGVNQLFIGEFRSQWMHFMRVAVTPSRTILMDDGAATLTIKRKFIDKGIYFPEDLWRGRGAMKEFVKRNIYRRFMQRSVLQRPIYLASAFLKNESLYPIDFSRLKSVFQSHENNSIEKKVFFFGSKYSESGIISLGYELDFIKKVKQFYSLRECDLIYCAHRDESEEKLRVIKERIGLEVSLPKVPAEIFLLEKNMHVLEVAGAYSSVLNNAKGMFPGVVIRAFRLEPESISPEHRENISLIYEHFVGNGVEIEF